MLWRLRPSRTCNSAARNRLLHRRHIPQKLGGRPAAGHKQAIPRSRTRDVKELSLGVIDLFNLSEIASGLNSVLERDNAFVAAHDRHCPKLQALGKVHGA